MTAGRGPLEAGQNRPAGEAAGRTPTDQARSAQPLTLASKDLTDVQIEALLKKTRNWPQVEPFVGKVARATDPAPPGYTWRTRNSRLELVRADGAARPRRLLNGVRKTR